jgi:hypothetical protein
MTCAVAAVPLDAQSPARRTSWQQKLNAHDHNLEEMRRQPARDSLEFSDIPKTTWAAQSRNGRLVFENLAHNHAGELLAEVENILWADEHECRDVAARAIEKAEGIVAEFSEDDEGWHSVKFRNADWPEVKIESEEA